MSVNERDEAVKRKLERVIACAKQFHRKIGICGQAPRDYPEFAQFLVEQGIDSISLNPDSVLKTRLAIAKTEGGLSHIEAVSFFDKMKQEKRFSSDAY